jgi:DNA-binding transcriptional MerR regulator
METTKFIGTRALAERLGISNSRIRQLEREGTIPAAQRLMPSDRRMWPVEDVPAIEERLRERRASRSRTPAASAA